MKLRPDLAVRLRAQAERLGLSVEVHLNELLDRTLAPEHSLSSAPAPKEGFQDLQSTLQAIPTVTKVKVIDGAPEAWSVELTIDIQQPMAWNVVQELGHVLNNLALTEPLPTAFLPISPPPYLNGGPQRFLRWHVSSTEPFVDPRYIARRLGGLLPSPVEDETAWLMPNAKAA